MHCSTAACTAGREYVHAQVVAVSHWHFHVFTIPRHSDSFRHSPLAEFGVGVRSFVGLTEGCCVGRAWRGRAATRGPVAIGSSRCSAGHTEAGIVVTIRLDITTTLLYNAILCHEHVGTIAQFYSIENGCGNVTFMTADPPA